MKCDDVTEILFTEEVLHQRVAEMGAEITRDYASLVAADGKPLIMACVLRGAAIFMSDLARAVELPTEMDYMVVSSYGKGTKSSGVVQLLKDLSSNIEGRHVIIAEDVLDSGLTLAYLMETLSTRKPASMTVATLMRKDTPGQQDVNCKYVGFECPDEFIVGYGMDYAERYRNLPYIGVLDPAVYTNAE